MKYVECLNSCINHAAEMYSESDLPLVEEMYCSYPIPSMEEWSECLIAGDACPLTSVDGEATFLDYMAQYERILSKKGIPTLSERRTIITLLKLVQEEGVHIVVMLNALDRFAAGMISREDIRGKHLN